MKTQTQLDRAADQRLRKVYGISLVEYEQLLEMGGGGCWICASKPTARRLHVDHDHGWKKIKVVSKNYPDCWQAVAMYNDVEYYSIGRTKREAVREVKSKLRRASVRGLLCYPHNAGLQKFSDNPKLLWNAGSYLNNFTQGICPVNGLEAA